MIFYRKHLRNDDARNISTLFDYILYLSGRKSEILDKRFPLVSEEFMVQAEKLIAEAAILEAQLAETPDAETQSKYENLIQQLEELINPPSDDDEDEDDEE